MHDERRGHSLRDRRLLPSFSQGIASQAHAFEVVLGDLEQFGPQGSVPVLPTAHPSLAAFAPSDSPWELVNDACLETK